jgi:hypothetical protein
VRNKCWEWYNNGWKRGRKPLLFAIVVNFNSFNLFCVGLDILLENTSMDAASTTKNTFRVQAKENSFFLFHGLIMYIYM